MAADASLVRPELLNDPGGCSRWSRSCDWLLLASLAWSQHWTRLRGDLHQADQVPLGVGELAEFEVGSGHRRGAENSGSPKALGL